MRYEIVSPTTGEAMTLEYPEWLRLLALASRYGGLPGEGLYHYYEEEGAAIPEETAGDIAEALARADADLNSREPRASDDPIAAGEAATVDVEALLEIPAEEALAFFVAGRQEIVSRFVRMGRTGELEVTQRQS